MTVGVTVGVVVIDGVTVIDGVVVTDCVGVGDGCTQLALSHEVSVGDDDVILTITVGVSVPSITVAQ